MSQNLLILFPRPLSPFVLEGGLPVIAFMLGMFPLALMVRESVISLQLVHWALGCPLLDLDHIVGGGETAGLRAEGERVADGDRLVE